VALLARVPAEVTKNGRSRDFMAAAPQRSESYKAQREVEDLHLVLRARSGNRASEAEIIRRYASFVRLRSSSYFIAGGDPDDLVQEGLVGLYKAIRDYRVDKDTTFRSFAELCITRQIITAIKTATRYKHAPLNTYVSFSHTPAGQDLDAECTLGDALPGPAVDDPATCVISTDELQSLLACLGSTLSPLESQVLTYYLEGRSYDAIGDLIGCDPKTVDNALQRVKRKVLAHLQTRRQVS
jgi:RNA polymerase sporulation-specific sigma factor